MWIKNGQSYVLNPRFRGKIWVITCDDLDGTVFTMLANRNPSPPTVIRKIKHELKRSKIPCLIDSDVRYTKGIIDVEGGLKKVACVTLKWKKEPMPYYSYCKSEARVLELPKKERAENEAVNEIHPGSV